MTDTIPNFVHLHVHTQYSLLDGAIRLDALLKRTKEFGMDSVALTDHGTMFGAVEFYEKATKAGIRPVIGCECYVAPRKLTDKDKGSSHLVLLAKNNEGYRNLCKMASLAQLKGFYYRPRIDKELLKAHHQGLIAMSACLHGEIPMLLKNGKTEQADDAARFYLDTFGEDNFFLEVQKNGLDIQETVNQGLLDMSQRLSVPLVATNDCHYLDKEDVRAHDVLLCIQTGKTVHDADRFKFGTDQLYFKSPQVMYEDFKDYPGAVENTAAVAERCSIEVDFKTYHFPQFDADSELTVDEIFEQKVREGYEKRLQVIRAKHPDIDETVYQERLEYEIRIIREMGFPGYFLIVADFIRYAKENGVPVGPGRGSAAGSIVAYALTITDLDPIEHGLIFERFLNPARISMPDIDVDFCINGREKVFKYVVERYGGGDYVAQIITFGKLKTRAVIRDVGRALDIPLREVDAIAKMVPDVLNISLDNALKEEPKLRELADTKPEIGELIRICRVLEGLPRHASTHAAGVVIGDKPLTEYLPLYKGKKGEVVTQFDMKYVEKIGLVKFDFLGLRNLTVIENALSLIAGQGKTPPDLLDLDFEDEATYQLLCKGDTTGVFQLESSGMKDLLTRLRPACFDDVTALVALYRPGPLDSGMVDDFVERKHGRKKVAYLVPELEPILKETYGVIVYQEQVMKIAGELASYSMAEADGLRKAMGKKIAEIMAEHRDRFNKGAVENGIPADKAKQLFDLMEKFGGYGFNKTVDRETKVYTTEGIKIIEDCKAGDEVITIGKDGCYAYSKVIQLHDHGHVPIWEVIFDDGTIEKCTIDHKWLTKYGQMPLWAIMQAGEQVWGTSSFKGCDSTETVFQISEHDSFRTDCCKGENHVLRRGCHNTQESQRTLSGLSRMPAEKQRGPAWGNICMGEQVRRKASDKTGLACSSETMLQVSQHDSKRSEFRQRENHVLRRSRPYKEESLRALSELSGLPCKTERNTCGNVQKAGTHTGNAAEILRNSQKDIFPSRYSAGTCCQTQSMEGTASGSLSGNSVKSTRFSQTFKTRKLDGTSSESMGIYKERATPLWKKEKAGGFCQQGKENSHRNGRSLAFFSNSVPGAFRKCTATGSDVGRGNSETILASDPPVNAKLQGQIWRAFFNKAGGTVCDDQRRNLDRNTVLRKPVRTTFLGWRQGYDLEVDHPEHNYVLASGLCCSNSHSAAYALIAYQTAYLKAHYPVEFMASLLTSEMHSIDGVVKFIAECKSHAIPVLPPDINESDKQFAVSDEKIRFGLVAVKNVGEGAIESIIEVREANGKFTSLFDFCEKADFKKVNKRVMESLIKCGAFDSFGAHRSQMLTALEDALDYGQRVQKEKASPQMGLFDMGESTPEINAPSLPQLDEWDEKQLLALEKESLGFYITGHPLGRFEDLLDRLTDTNTLLLREKSDGVPVRIGGIITGVKTIKTKRGDTMAFITTEDMHGTVETVVFSSVYTEVLDILTEDMPVLIEGQLQKDENSVKILAETIIPMNKAEETRTASVHLHLDVTRTDREKLLKLNDVLKKHPGSCQAYIHLLNPSVTETRIALADTLQLKAGSALTREVNELMGYDVVETVCKTVKINGNSRKGRNGYARP